MVSCIKNIMWGLNSGNSFSPELFIVHITNLFSTECFDIMFHREWNDTKRRLSKMSNTTKRRLLQNVEITKMSNTTKHRLLQNIEITKMSNTTKRRLLEMSKLQKC